ncbi:ABC transporter ATP-binding protein [Amorphus orientalis]|uniref:Multiple sugar transport system ATP-binding protein n=1 Tax=Amorphus orientalis TaxID=649198 RepID=A0AAE4ASU0_9HYPH|nr:ABC transporter ATP-binding protein [Amorphus orientalis]MDQ0315345.1 multiple sugar transport system ATP-binding protein [Amorphus orientalis]
MVEIAFQAVTKDFGATRAVESLSFTMQDGEFFALLGPTGAGKTTTLRLVAGLERPDYGRILIGGRDATSLSPPQRDVAFVFQQYSLYPHLTVFENLAFPLKAPGKRLSDKDIKSRVEAVAEKLRIEHKLGNKATRLSGGEMQRVSIGRALVREPACFLMDEPLSSLDAKLREELRAELKHLQVELGATILYVTHDQVEAMTLADRVGVLIDGRLHQIDAPEVLYETPADVAVAQQVGHLPINLFSTEALGLTGSGIDRIGIRPEHVRIVPAAEAGPDDTLGDVVRTERLGAEDVITVSAGGTTVYAAQPPAPVGGVAGRIAVRIEPAFALAFDRDGNRLPVRTGDRNAAAFVSLVEAARDLTQRLQTDGPDGSETQAEEVHSVR